MCFARDYLECVFTVKSYMSDIDSPEARDKNEGMGEDLEEWVGLVFWGFFLGGARVVWEVCLE